MSKLDEIRAKLQAMDDRRNGKNRAPSDKSLYAHWNLKDGEQSVVRFLPDANPDNTFFWVERQMIRLTFPGIVGESDGREVVVQVPCMEMWNESCPILQEIRPWFNDPALEDVARKYWKKRTYYFQGFVRKDGLNEEELPENPIRKFAMTTQIFTPIKAALLDPEMENIPTDYENGSDFTIIKGTKGGWADYSTSKYARRESPLTQEERDAIEEYGLVDLSTYLPKKPTSAEMAVIMEMFEASVNGDQYDPSRWAEYYRPPGLEYSKPQSESSQPAESKEHRSEPEAEQDAPVAPTQSAAPAPEAEAEKDDAPTAPSASADDILAMIRNRKSS